MIATVATTPSARVWLDGVEQKYCWYANDVRGIVRCYKADDKGIIRPATWYEAHGEVRIELPTR